MRRRERLRVVANEAVGPYALLRVERGGLDPGHPGPVLHARGAGPAAATADEPLPGAGRRAERSCSRRSAREHGRSQQTEPGEEIHVFGPLGNGYRLDVEKPLLVGGGIGVAPFPYLSERLGGPPAILGFRSDWHAEAAALVPNAEVVVEPTLVTEPLADLVTAVLQGLRVRARADAGGRARAGARCPARLGGADGVRLRRVLRMLGGDRRRSPAPLRRRAGAGGRVILNASGCLDALEAPEVARALDAFVTKTVTPLPREGNRPVRIAETEAGMLNSIGLENPGIEGLLADKLPRLARARRPALGLGRRVRGVRLRGDLRRARRSAGGDDDRAQPLVPERRRGARERRRDRRRGPPADAEAALREALAGRDRPPRDRASRPGRGRRRALAREHDQGASRSTRGRSSRGSGTSSAATPAPA